MSDDWTKKVIARLVETISNEVPQGIGEWDEAWERVERPARALLSAVWKLEHGRGARREVVNTGIALRDVWRQLSEEWQAREKIKDSQQTPRAHAHEPGLIL